MIKEHRASRWRVAVAFGITGVVGILPLLLLFVVNRGGTAAVIDQGTRYGGTAVVAIGVVLVVGVVAGLAASVRTRRRLHPTSA